MNFLEKVISKVEYSLKIDIDAKPSKIVSGLEADKTCKFLQLLVVASTKNDEGLYNKEISMTFSSKIETNTLDLFETTENNQFVDNLSNDMNVGSEQTLQIEEETHDVDNQPQLLSMRPKTARRRPPRTKQENNVEEAKYKSFSETKAAIIKDGNDQCDNLVGDNSEPHEFLIDTESITTINQDNTKNTNQGERSADDKDGSHQTRNSGIKLHLNIQKSKDKALTANSVYTSNGFATIMQGIQSMVKNVTPLGKTMENLHDTFSQMVKEEQFWNSEYKKYSEELESEKKKTDDSLESLHTKLSILDNQLRKKRDEVMQMKINIDARKRKQMKYWREMMSGN